MMLRTSWIAIALLAAAACVSDDPAEDASLGDSAAHIVGGSTVTGAGPDQRWGGIVKLTTTAGGCTATFISARHLLTSAHCFDRAGEQDVRFSAPGLSARTRDADVHILDCWWDGGSRSCDLAVVELDHDESWATHSKRKLYLYGGSTIVGYQLHPYGYGYENYEGGGGGVLRGGSNRAVLTIDDHEDGYFEAIVGAVRPCEGDSGGPATFEAEGAPAFRPIIWGVYHASEDGGRATCAEKNEIMWWTKITTNLAWIDDVLDGACRDVPGIPDAQQCW